jgi:hypothetical protein
VIVDPTREMLHVMMPWMHVVVVELLMMYRFVKVNKSMVKVYRHARRIPSLLRGSVEVCVAAEDILPIVFDHVKTLKA